MQRLTSSQPTALTTQIRVANLSVTKIKDRVSIAMVMPKRASWWFISPEAGLEPLCGSALIMGVGSLSSGLSTTSNEVC